MISWVDCVKQTAGFAVAGLVYQGIAHLVGWKPYPIADLFPLSFGYFCGAMSIRRIANKMLEGGRGERREVA